MKTILEWLNDLPEMFEGKECRGPAIENYENETSGFYLALRTDQYSNLGDAFRDAFCWGDSREGYNFWQAVYYNTFKSPSLPETDDSKGEKGVVEETLKADGDLIFADDNFRSSVATMSTAYNQEIREATARKLANAYNKHVSLKSEVARLKQEVDRLTKENEATDLSARQYKSMYENADKAHFELQQNYMSLQKERDTAIELLWKVYRRGFVLADHGDDEIKKYLSK